MEQKGGGVAVCNSGSNARRHVAADYGSDPSSDWQGPLHAAGRSALQDRTATQVEGQNTGGSDLH